MKEYRFKSPVTAAVKYVGIDEEQVLERWHSDWCSSSHVPRRPGSAEVHHPGDIFRDGRGAGGAVDCLRVAHVLRLVNDA